MIIMYSAGHSGSATEHQKLHKGLLLKGAVIFTVPLKVGSLSVQILHNSHMYGPCQASLILIRAQKGGFLPVT